MGKRYFQKSINKNSAKDMFNFLIQHYQYDTMNSWNGLKSIANNVKLYNLNLDGDYTIILDLIFTDWSPLVEDINFTIEDFEENHPNYMVGFNGRSDGYLVLYNKDNNKTILPDWIKDYDYDGFKENIKYYGENVKDYLPDLQFYTNLVQDFDKLCDNLRSIVNWYINNYNPGDEEAI